MRAVVIFVGDSEADESLLAARELIRIARSTIPNKTNLHFRRPLDFTTTDIVDSSSVLEKSNSLEREWSRNKPHTQ